MVCVCVSRDAKGKYQFLRGIVHEGCIFGLPSNADSVLKIDPVNETLQTFGDVPAGSWKWHGGQLSPHDNMIYCIPANANRVLKVDPTNLTTELIGPELPRGTSKWCVTQPSCVVCNTV